VAGKIATDAQHTVTSVDTTKAERWIWAPNTPTVCQYCRSPAAERPEDNRCGKAVMSDIHVRLATTVGEPGFGGCTTSGLASWRRCSLMIFDIACCVGSPDRSAIAQAEHHVRLANHQRRQREERPAQLDLAEPGVSPSCSSSSCP
jgi:hypothetical protein